MRQSRRESLIWLLWLAWSFLLGLSLAVAVSTVLFGRTPLPQLVLDRRGLLLLVVIVLPAAAWWLAHAYLLHRKGAALQLRAALVPSIPLVLVSMIPMAVIYASDVANHYFHYSMVHLNEVRSLALLVIALLLTLLLQVAEHERAACSSYGDAISRAIQRTVEPFSMALLLLMGLLQGTAYLTHLGNDFLRYWAIADALSAAVQYPAMVSGPEYVDGGMPPYIVDLPLFPALLWVSFGLFGHDVAAGYLPIVLSNVAVPPLTYLFFREVVQSRMAAFSLTALVVLFPPMRFYTLNWPVPDATFFAVLMAYSWLFVRLVRGEGRGRMWLMFGSLAAACALLRPEGAAYAGIYLLVALARAPMWRHRILGASAFLVPVGGFSALLLTTFGILWPQNWTGTVSFENILGNWQMLSTGTLQMFASSLRLSVSELLGYSMLLLVLALIGSWPGLYRPRLLAVLMLPAWLNLLSVFMVDPWVSGARLWLDFFRHLSYPLPYLLLAAWIAARAILASIRTGTFERAGLVCLNGLLIAGVLWNVHYLAKPTPTFGNDAGRLLAADRVNFFDAVRHPLELPVLEFRLSNGRNVPVIGEQFQAWYPAAVHERYRPFDPVRETTGSAYQTGTLYLYLSGLALLVGAGLAAVRRLPLSYLTTIRGTAQPAQSASGDS